MTTKRQSAAKLLAFFGSDGENWRNGTGNGMTTACLTEAIDLLGVEGKEKDVIEGEIKKLLKVKDRDDVQGWNDKQRWPAVKKLIVSIRDGRKFNKAAAEALTDKAIEKEVKAETANV